MRPTLYGSRHAVSAPLGVDCHAASSPAQAWGMRWPNRARMSSSTGAPLLYHQSRRAAAAAAPSRLAPSQKVTISDMELVLKENYPTQMLTDGGQDRCPTKEAQ